jgi:hypothetical protein
MTAARRAEAFAAQACVARWWSLSPTLARLFAVSCLLVLSAAGGAVAQQLVPPPAAAPAPPPPPGAPQSSDQPPPGRVFCEQNVTYQLADPASVPDQFRRFVGVWSDAAWDVRTCAALIVQDVKPDGMASIVYVYGPEGSISTITGGVLHGTGVIRGDELRFQNSDGSQYAFRPGIVDMTGHWINPQGESFQATFKQTP